MNGPTIRPSSKGSTRRTTKPPRSRSCAPMTRWIDIGCPRKSVPAGQGLEEIVVKLDAGVVGIDPDALILAMGAHIVAVHRDAADPVARNARIHGVNAVRRSGLHDGYHRGAGPQLGRH